MVHSSHDGLSIDELELIVIDWREYWIQHIKLVAEIGLE